jgi:hypothetical protein
VSPIGIEDSWPSLMLADLEVIAAGIEEGRLQRSVSKRVKPNRDSLSDWAVWLVVEQSSKQIGIERFGATRPPPYLRQTLPEETDRCSRHLRFGRGHPRVDALLDPDRNSQSPDAPALALEVGQNPPSLALLDGRDVELGQFATSAVPSTPSHPKPSSSVAGIKISN